MRSYNYRVAVVSALAHPSAASFRDGLASQTIPGPLSATTFYAVISLPPPPKTVIGFTVVRYLIFKSTVVSEQHSYVAILQFDAGRFDQDLCQLQSTRRDL